LNIMLIGEIANATEERSRYNLKAMMSQVGINIADCYSTTVFGSKLSEVGDIKELCGPKAEGIKGMPALIKGKYVNARYVNELARLYKEINSVNPNLIIALGATASWAILGSSGIRAIRGAPCGTTAPGTAATGSVLHRTFKVLPTYHPAAVSRDWTLRPIVLSDLDKAKRYSTTPELVRPARQIWIEPTLEDLKVYEDEYINKAAMLSIDIETKGDQITCIGFAPDPTSAIVIPFFAEGYPKCNYWPSLADELTAWDYVNRWCNLKPSVFQNGLYDIHRLWRTYGITCRLAEDDTMLLHHALQPEMEKGLGFLGTIYTDEASWKFMSRMETLKKED
jgi:hypothetical protein